MRRQVAAVEPGRTGPAGQAHDEPLPVPVGRPPGLDVTGLDGVLSVDPQARTADVLGMTTYEHLVDATLPYGLMPLVVPQLRPSPSAARSPAWASSRRRSATGCRTSRCSRWTSSPATAGCRHRDAPTASTPRCSTASRTPYGSLGYALRLRIELEPVQPYVMLTHVRFTTRATELAERDGAGLRGAVDRRRARSTSSTAPCSARTSTYLTVGTFVDEAPYTSDYTGQDIYYRSIQRRRRDFLTVRDYLWRWDTDWFWCSRALGRAEPAGPAARARGASSAPTSTWKVVGFERRHGVDGAHRRTARPPGARGRRPGRRGAGRAHRRLPRLLPPRGRHRAGVAVPAAPARPRASRGTCTRSTPTATYVNVGFWSTRRARAGRARRRPQPPDRARSSPSWAAASRSTARRTTTRTSSGPTYNGADYAC